MLSFGTAAHAVVYKWVEDDGRVIYSNEPPPDPGNVRELTRIDDLDLVPADRRPVPAAPPQSSQSGESAATTTAPVTLIPREAPQRPSPELTVTKSAQPVTQTPPRPVMLLGREPVTLLPKEPAPATVEIEPPPRVIPRSTHTGAVQDPCLVSPDPRCHEINRDRYHPYLGYLPPGAPVAQAAGASSGAAAGGAVGAQVAASKRGAQALPPGSAPIAGARAPR